MNFMSNKHLTVWTLDGATAHVYPASDTPEPRELLPVAAKTQVTQKSNFSPSL